MTDQSRNRSWLDHPFWDWYVMPFRVIGNLILFLIVSPLILIVALAFAIILPAGLVDGWRSRRRENRKLNADGRKVSWNAALAERGRGHKELIVEVGPKHTGRFWLVELTPEAAKQFASCPTINNFETDPRSVWEQLTTANNDSHKALTSIMQAAKLVEDSPKDFSKCDRELKDTVRVFTVFNLEAPSRLLRASITSDTNG